MTPNDPNSPTVTQAPQEPLTASEGDWDVGLAAAFGRDDTRPQPVAAEMEPGAILAGKYRLTERIGEGGMGSVYMAQQ